MCQHLKTFARVTLQYKTIHAAFFPPPFCNASLFHIELIGILCENEECSLCAESASVTVSLLLITTSKNSVSPRSLKLQLKISSSFSLSHRPPLLLHLVSTPDLLDVITLVSCGSLLA